MARLGSCVFLFILETTAFTLSFVVALLAVYPEVQQRIYEEAVALWPDSTLPITVAVFISVP